ncbi:LysR family transcriptional regulator [Sphingomonas sp. AX6]|uniref:LysR family transcriptional regulator n=1 Tax=Sphingomonas sp. AX6 TaxID=2653171 RepID=UPI0012EF210F|nr:LysR family transcriptional regulator [Sphingomonas sp. AX6]VXC81838.1 conserved hypothetical protein [Sphingomonas sp. AX6]
MDWSDLPFFLAVARTGQIARAATATGTDATTVGRRIRRLERSIGERLFEQTGEGQVLTPTGNALLDKVEAMARIAGEVGEATRGEQPLRGAVRVSVAEGFGTWFVSRHLGEFADAHPGVEVDLVASSGFLNPGRRETDLAVLLARPRRGPLMVRKLADYRLRLYGAAADIAARPVGEPRDLNGRRMIGYIPDILYAPELRYLDELPIDGVPQLRSSSINAQAKMIAAGAGIGILPCFIGDAEMGLCAILPDLSIERSFWLTTHRETQGFAQVRAFADWLIALANRHRGVLNGENYPVSQTPDISAE